MSRICWKCYGQKPPTIPHADSDCIVELRRRVEQIESKLGAAPSGVGSVSAADCSDVHAMSGQSIRQAGESVSVPTAAPSVSAEDFKAEANYQRGHGATDAARACDLAAAVTEWFNGEGEYRFVQNVNDLVKITREFVRGEPLPERGK